MQLNPQALTAAWNAGYVVKFLPEQKKMLHLDQKHKSPYT